MTSTALKIADTGIKQDAEGRYCLNDLHRAAGGEKKDQPNDFLRRVESRALVAELANSGDSRNYEPVTRKAGRHGGTFVVKELVYAYAMWISVCGSIPGRRPSTGGACLASHLNHARLWSIQL
nr:KilA-N domain protein [Virgibacillus halodenitrificans]